MRQQCVKFKKVPLLPLPEAPKKKAGGKRKKIVSTHKEDGERKKPPPSPRWKKGKGVRKERILGSIPGSENFFSARNKKR